MFVCVCELLTKTIRCRGHNIIVIWSWPGERWKPTPSNYTIVMWNWPGERSSTRTPYIYILSRTPAKSHLSQSYPSAYSTKHLHPISLQHNPNSQQHPTKLIPSNPTKCASSYPTSTPNASTERNTSSSNPATQPPAPGAETCRRFKQ